ncbi:MAG: di-trans,poly-cis-decaprenylcistransferase [Clostridia bacterium]|nr:di-trans,poly-cis-decaprenylcistransferase [Clostridia bacterium]
MALFKRNKDQQAPLPTKPRHIGIIMDGNGRWAKKRGLPRLAGHREGAENFKRIAEYLVDLDIEVATFYAFSTENWKRPKEEVENIMGLLVAYLQEWMTMRKDKNVHFRFIGDRSAFSTEIQALMAEVEEKSSIYPNQLNLALNYGSRDELCRAFSILANEGKKDITPDDISRALYTYDRPDVDLIIRTGGEMRLSNFLLYQSAYAEFYFTDKLWPDIKNSDIDDAIAYFAGRERRFGGVIESKK